MGFALDYGAEAPKRTEIDQIERPLVLEFGNSWCGFCQAADPMIRQAFESNPGVQHIRIADSRASVLGRTFGVKLWPTLVFMNSGSEVARIVRPTDTASINKCFEKLLQI